jgi:LysM repeat protein
MARIFLEVAKLIAARACKLLAAAGLGVLVCVLAAALVPAQNGWTPALATPGLAGLAPVPGSAEGFASERLAAFSGTDFDLRPDLTVLVDAFAQRLPAKAPVSAACTVAPTLYADTNPAFVTFTRYRIQRGDNFWKLAKRSGYTIDTIVGCNPVLSQVSCQNGQEILLPSRGGCLHQVGPTDSLQTLALDYRVEAVAIEAANRIRPELGLVPGMWLFIPGAKPLHLSEGMHAQYSKRALFRSPLTGRYTSFVGNRLHPVLGFSRYHAGVDIACPNRSWVGAAASGVVIGSGWGGGLGKYIKIDHENGFVTVYGHLSEIYIRTGKRVRGGQLIARSGSTGLSTGPHLHFGIYDHGRVRNPMDYLW